MSFIQIHHEVSELYEGLSPTEQRVIEEKLEKLIDGGRLSFWKVDSKEVHVDCEQSVYRLRVGDHRVFFITHRNGVIIVGLKRRRKAYTEMQDICRRVKNFAPSMLSAGDSTGGAANGY